MISSEPSYDVFLEVELEIQKPLFTSFAGSKMINSNQQTTSVVFVDILLTSYS